MFRLLIAFVTALAAGGNALDDLLVQLCAAVRIVDYEAVRHWALLARI